jgi:hypothetical protein
VNETGLDPGGQVDLAQVEGAQRGFLLVGDGLVRLARRNDDDTGEGQVAVGRPQLVGEPDGAAEADDLGAVGP